LIKTPEQRKELAKKTYEDIKKRRSKKRRKLETEITQFQIDAVHRCGKGREYGSWY
jgi:hypothetical protein